MKKIGVFLLTILFIALSDSQAQSFIGVTWKVNEYYLDSMSIESGTIDSLRYHFRADGTMEMRQPQTSTTQFLSYSFNPGTSEITIFEVNQISKVLKVIFSDISNLIFTTTDLDSTTGEILHSEFRMIPVSP